MAEPPLSNKRALELWNQIRKTAGQDIKRHITKNYSDQILNKYTAKINSLINRYLASLPPHVKDAEGDDLANVARIEFFETIKAWDPDRSKDIWPLAFARITGSMRDQIRYVTKASPARLYNWITDASYVFTTVEEETSFENKIESGVILNEIMRELDRKEKFIIISRFKHDRTFKEIGEMIGVSESQTTRIYKDILKKMKKLIGEKGVGQSDT